METQLLIELISEAPALCVLAFLLFKSYALFSEIKDSSKEINMEQQKSSREIVKQLTDIISLLIADKKNDEH